jgi:hypothetical protein
LAARTWAAAAKSILSAWWNSPITIEAEQQQARLPLCASTHQAAHFFNGTGRMVHLNAELEPAK